MYLRSDWSPSPEDLALLEQYLTAEERELFERMDPPDRQHSFKVANLCARSLDNFPDANRDEIMKAALLHDVGKIGANLDLGFRTCWVLSHKVAPWLMDWLSLHSEHSRPGTFRHKMWLQRTHAHAGAQVLRELGVAETVCKMVEATATRREPGDPLDWQIIKAADGDVVLAPGDEKG